MDRRCAAAQKKTPQRMQKYLFRTQLLLLIPLALVLTVAGLLLDLHGERQKRDQNLRNVAEAIACSPVLQNEAERTASLDTLKSSLGDIDVISVVGAEGTRVYHSNHELIGTVYDGTQPDFSRDGNGFYATDDVGPSGTQRRAYAAIGGGNGENGFVITVTLRDRIRSETIRMIAAFAGITLLAVLSELLISYRLSDRIKKSLLGFEPEALSSMYVIRDHILESLDEGVVAVDRDGNTQFMNKAAGQMLSAVSDAPDEEAGKLLLTDTLKDGTKERGVSLHDPDGTDILMDRIPIREDGAVTGAVAILHDRTEYTKLMEDLAGTRYLVDSMRANNHDFTNKLHVILGMLQMQMVDEAAAYIENITIVQREAISRIMQAVDEPAISALLVGKTARASELNVRLTLREGSVFRKADISLPADALVTILGNLIDNALEAMNACADREEQKELVLGVFSKPGALLLTADDNGPGMPEDVLSRIFENGFSTKGEGRGTGLAQVKKLVESLGGVITAESQEGAGTSFTVSFRREK